MARLRLVATVLLLAGFGPFVCDQPDVEEAREALRQANAEAALTSLGQVEDDAPEVHLARAVAHLQLEDLDAASAALDQAYRLVAEMPDGEDAEPLREEALRTRIAFTRGLIALRREAWDDAQVEFAQALRLDPDDEDARWNLELAWHRANPPCPVRDDDHEQDDTRADAKPYQPPQQGQGQQGGPPQQEKSKLLCPADEDWYAFEAPRDTILFVTVEGEIDTSDGETREAHLELYAPSDPDDQPIRKAPLIATSGNQAKAVVGVTGLPESGQWKARLFGPGKAEVKYELKVEVVPPCPADDDAEENDAAEQAHVLQEPQKQGLKACPDDPDWFQLQIPAKDEEVQVSVQFDPSRAQLVATLFDPATMAPLAAGRKTAQGLALPVEQGEEPKTVLLHVEPEGRDENTYAIQVGPPGDGQQDQDQQEQDEEEEKEKDEKEDSEQQDQQEKQDQKQDQQQPQPPPEEQVDRDKLIDMLDQQDRNPQLEKALRELKVVPQMEDY